MESILCPVCGMNVSENNLSLTLEHKNRLYHFCSYICKTAFSKHPELFVEDTGESKITGSAVKNHTEVYRKEVAS